MKHLLLFLLLSVAGCNRESEPSGKVLLAIFAHPDDESSVGPLLAKYASEGVSVYVAVATDGRLGVAAHAGIPAGDSLAAVRVEEMKCAAQQLGAHPPILMGMHDQLRMKEGLAAVRGQLDTIRSTVARLFMELKPDVVITWGPSGWTGHHDHRLVGSIVSEVFGSRQWTKPTQLYYCELPSGSLSEETAKQLSTVDLAYLPVQVKVSADDYAKAKAAWLCHKSQYTKETIDHLFTELTSSQKGVMYFRPFVMKQSKDFFPN